MSTRITGRVKFFNEDKGFGFIARDHGGKDVFLHRSALPPGYSTLEDGTAVEFDLVDDKKGVKAAAVQVIG